MASSFTGSNWIYRLIRHRTILALISILFFTTAGALPETNREINRALYSEVQIGRQVWMAENLDVASFQNGDLIPEVKSNEEWQKAGRERRPAWCYYNNEVGNGKKYGKLYNWYAVNDSRRLYPLGWHLPTLEEWIDFEKLIADRQAAILFRCTERPKSFCALAGGYRFSDGSFTGMGEFTYLSGATYGEVEDSNGSRQTVLWGRGLHILDQTSMRCGLRKDFGLYVRCIKD